MQVCISFRPEITEEVEQYIKATLPEIINNVLLEDTTQLNRMITECVKGYIKGTITELMQGKDFRNFLRDKIMEQVGMKDEISRCDVLQKIEKLCCGNLPKDELLASDDLQLTDEGILSKRIMEAIERGNNGN